MPWMRQTWDHKVFSIYPRNMLAVYMNYLFTLNSETPIAHYNHHIISMFIKLKFNCNTTLWDLMPCNVVATYQYFLKTCYLHHLPLRRNQQVPPKHLWQMAARPCGITSWKAVKNIWQKLLRTIQLQHQVPNLHSVDKEKDKISTDFQGSKQSTGCGPW